MGGLICGRHVLHGPNMYCPFAGLTELVGMGFATAGLFYHRLLLRLDTSYIIAQSGKISQPYPETQRVESASLREHYTSRVQPHGFVNFILGS